MKTYVILSKENFCFYISAVFVSEIEAWRKDINQTSEYEMINISSVSNG